MLVLVFAFWAVLNGRITGEIVWLGAVMSALAMFFLCRFCDWSWKKEAKLYLIFPRLTVYSLILIREIIKANMALCRIVYGPKPDPVVRTIHTGLKTRFCRMLLANSITLTPGTITLSCKGDELTVHCLNDSMAEGLDGIVFEAYLQKVEAVLHG